MEEFLVAGASRDLASFFAWIVTNTKPPAGWSVLDMNKETKSGEWCKNWQ